MLSQKEKNRRKNTKRERNQAVVDMYDTGKYTLEEVGKHFGISRQRAHQIVKRAGIEGKLVAKVRNRKNRVEIVCKNCGKKKEVQKAKKDQKYCSLDCFGEDYKKYTNKQLIEILKKIKQKHGKITSTLIIKEAPPSYTTFTNRLGGIKTLKELVK